MQVSKIKKHISSSKMIFGGVRTIFILKQPKILCYGFRTMTTIKFHNVLYADHYFETNKIGG